MKREEPSLFDIGLFAVGGVSFVIASTVIINGYSPSYNQGVIDASMDPPRATAELVEQPDGTTEWVVTRLEGE